MGDISFFCYSYLIESFDGYCSLVAVDGTQKLAIGTATGVYFKTIGGGRPRPIISSKNVMQLGVMQKYQILLVLAGNDEEIIHTYNDF